MLNEIFLLQLFNLFILCYFSATTNILTLWYLAGLYLISTGFLLLIDHGDIFIGFLWVIDLGVGLIFFVFILHLTKFLHQKNLTTFFLKNTTSAVFSLIFLFFFYTLFALPFDYNNYELKKSWFFLISWYDYYTIYYSRIVTDLNLLRELYFYNNSFEFFIINFMLFYAILISITLTFLLKRVFSFLNSAQFKNMSLLLENMSTLMIRNQNFIRQQNTSTGTRVWKKKQNFTI